MMKVIFNNCPTSIFYYFKIFRRMYLKNSKFKFFQDICSNQKRKQNIYSSTYPFNPTYFNDKDKPKHQNLINVNVHV